jgi:hypothetical protein
MPCPACKISFSIDPCKHESGEFIGIEILIDLRYKSVSESIGYKEFTMECFKELHFNCPCKECLVKMQCNLKFDDRCDEYKQMIDKIREKYYDGINGVFRRANWRNQV